MMIQEKTRTVASGYVALVVLPLLTAGIVWMLVRSIMVMSVAYIILNIVLLVVMLILFLGFFMVHPNQAKVLQLFGTYVGSVRQTGLRWANPFYSKETVSLRVRNFESGQMKVNDS